MDSYSSPNALTGSVEPDAHGGSLEPHPPGPGATPIYAFTTSDPAHAAPSPVLFRMFLPSGARRPHNPTYPGIFSTSRGNLLPALSLGLSTRFGGAAGPFLPTFAPEHGLNEADAQAAFERWDNVYQATGDGRAAIWAKRHG